MDGSHGTMRARLSVALITLNEEQNLPRTLASIRFADEVVVLDSGSTDSTIAIAQQFGATVTAQPWLGFAQQKNAAIERCTGDWVLSLDADEELTPELQRSMQQLLSSPAPATNAYRIGRRNMFLGRWMRHGGYYPDSKLRLFRREETNGFSTPRFAEREVHEVLTYDGPIETLDGDLIHHAYPTLSSYIEHMDRYSTLGAQLLIRHKRTSRNIFSFVGNVLCLPLLTIGYNYILRGGFLDGREGLLQHLYHAVYTSWKYAKAWETGRQSTPTTPAP
jgi:glycosyltransferase involved in cell wall biosynthesis